MKRILEVVVAVMALLLLSPFLLVIAAAVRCNLGSPVLFKQLRPGLGGRPFALYKFRTMTDSRDKRGRLLSDAERLTPFGRFLRKTSMDELPELINIIKGDMSLIGPRPLLMEYLPLYNEFQQRRHEVKPGITGWAQVNGRNAVSWEERFQMDVWYVDNANFLLDLKIIWLTFWKILKREGVNQEGQATVEYFKGNRE